MKTDRLTKVLLGIIAIALLIIASKPWLRPMSVVAKDKVSFSCTGGLEANSWGGVEPKVGGYSVRLYCD